MRVLLIEDEQRLAQSIAQILKDNKMNVDIQYDGLQGYYYGLSDEYDIIILDVMLPRMNGFEVLDKLREEKVETPIIMLTAKSTVEDKIEGLNRGADDYLTKPFNVEELIARIRALTRRKGEVVLEELSYHDLSLNTQNHLLACGTKSVRLGLKEYDLMELLLTNPNQIFSKEQILSKVWGMESDVDENNVEAYISFLRKKLFFLKTKVRINTVRKVGYHLEIADD